MKNWKGFSNHLRKHKISSKEYWNLYPYQYEEPAGIYGVNYVTCPICNDNRQFQSLTQHIINKHNLTIEKFLQEYPNAKLFTNKYSEMRSKFCKKGLRKNWSNPEYKKKRSEYCSEFFSRINSGSSRLIQSKVLTETLNRLWQDPEYRNKQSERMKQRHKSGEIESSILSGFHKNWIKYEKLDGTIITLKSSYELIVAEFLDSNSIVYEYEKVYDYFDSIKRCNRKYYADFYLPDYNIVLEVKASWALDNQCVRDKMIGVLNTKTNYKFITERELEKLVSKEEFEMLIQSNI